MTVPHDSPQSQVTASHTTDCGNGYADAPARRAFAINYLRNGGDLFTLQKLMGHSDLSVLRRYLKLTDTDIQTAHALHSPVERMHDV